MIGTPLVNLTDKFDPATFPSVVSSGTLNTPNSSSMSTADNTTQMGPAIRAIDLQSVERLAFTSVTVTLSSSPGQSSDGRTYGKPGTYYFRGNTVWATAKGKTSTNLYLPRMHIPYIADKNNKYGNDYVYCAVEKAVFESLSKKLVQAGYAVTLPNDRFASDKHYWWFTINNPKKVLGTVVQGEADDGTPTSEYLSYESMELNPENPTLVDALRMNNGLQVMGECGIPIRCTGTTGTIDDPKAQKYTMTIEMANESGSIVGLGCDIKPPSGGGLRVTKTVPIKEHVTPDSVVLSLLPSMSKMNIGGPSSGARRGGFARGSGRGQ